MGRRGTLAAATCVLALAPPASAAADRLDRGSVAMAVDTAFGLALVQHGVDARAIAPATQDALTFRQPVIRARVSASGRTANVLTAGALSLKDPGKNVDVELHRQQLKVRKGVATLSAYTAVKGLGVTRFTLARGPVTKVRRTPLTYTLKADLRLTEFSADTLNSQLQTREFKPGQPYNTVTVRCSRRP